jgi:hypothetical protein
MFGFPTVSRTGTAPAERKGMLDKLYGDGVPTDTQAARADMTALDRTQLEPPHPHMAGLYVKGALAINKRSRRSRKPDGSRTVEKEVDTEKASSNEVIFFALCFKKEEEGQVFASRVRDFKRYALSLVFWPFLETLSGARKPHTEEAGSSYIQREAFQWGLQPTEVDAVLSALQPPPPPDPKLEKKIPTMKLEDDGRVLWYVPKKKKPLQQRGATLMRFNSFQ